MSISAFTLTQEGMDWWPTLSTAVKPLDLGDRWTLTVHRLSPLDSFLPMLVEWAIDVELQRSTLESVTRRRWVLTGAALTALLEERPTDPESWLDARSDVRREPL